MDYFKVVVENVLPLVVAILSPVLLLLVKRLVVWMEAKLDFDLSIENEARLQDILKDAIAFGEEKALQAVKKGEKCDGAQKLDAAMQFAVEQIRRLGWDEKLEDKLVDLIEAKLFQVRVPQ